MTKRRIQLFATLLLFIVSNVIFFVGGRKVQTRDLSYEPVKVTVVSATQTRRTSGKYRSYVYDVVVEYEGKKYELINVKSGEMIRYEALANLAPELQHNNPYMDNTVYFSEGKMYSNIDGIRTDSREFDWYMTGLAGICVFGFWHLMCVVYEVDKKKKDERSI
ncbi:MAG: hypothetical protein IJ429_05370 [Lachnospiraceae bacterium]|nr:hypothetical protein [Lachnospiraceae bacterium]